MTSSFSSSSYLELKSVSVARGGREILREVSLSISPGECVCIVGPNGGGKTTAIRIALGLDSPDSGEAKLAPEIAVGYLPQRNHFRRAIPLTVRGFLNLRRRHSDNELSDALAEAGLAAALGQSVHSLSGGQIQRMLLARVLLARPPLLVLDEPTQGMDISGESEFYGVIERHLSLHPQAAVLLVSHDLERVMLAADRVYCINRHLCCHGDADAVRADPRFRAQFGRAPHIGVYQHHHQSGAHPHD